MKDLLKNKKQLMMVGGALALVIIIIIVIAVLVSGKESPEKITASLEEELKNLGIEYYETKYYPTFEKVEQLANFKDTGVNISVTNLKVSLPLSKEVEKKLADKNCNLDNTKVLFYPESPYGAKDYSIKVELACEK